MKKIEEGCLALVVGGRVKENLGKIVRVGKFIGKYNNPDHIFMGDDWWEVDKLMIMRYENSLFLNDTYKFALQRESNLMRIDEFPEEILEDNSKENKIEDILEAP